MKVYRYGLQAPVERAEVLAQIALANEYQNELVALHRRARNWMRWTEAALGVPSIEAEQQAVEDVLVRVRRERSRTRSRKVSPELERELAVARKALSEARKNFNAKRTKVRAERKKVFAQISEEVNKQSKILRGKCGVHWGTYQLAEEAMKQSAKMPLFARGLPNDPEFRSLAKGGSVSVQLSHGRTVKDLEDDLSIQVRDVSAHKNPLSRRAAKRRFIELKIRIGSTDKRAPVWAVFPGIMHRPLPEGCKIKRVTVKYKRIGPREEWYALFTVDRAPRKSNGKGGRVAIDLGWRKRDDGLRAAAWRAEDGSHGEILIPDVILAKFNEAEAFQSGRDKAVDLLRDRLMARLIDGDLDLLRAIRAVAKPEEELEAKTADFGRNDFSGTRTMISRWKSPRRFHRLLRELQRAPERDVIELVRAATFEERRALARKHFIEAQAPHCHRRDMTGMLLEHEEALVRWHATEGNARGLLTTWAAFDKIAWELANEVRTTALRRRLDFYRVTARDLANHFATVVLEQDAKKNAKQGRSAKPMDIAKLANRKDKDPDKDLHDAAHSQRHSAATGELRDALLNAFGNAADYVPAQYTTSTCAACGALETWDRAELEHVCSKCGSHWDQDDNACKNLLAYATPESTRPVETVYEGKYAKGKRLKKEREAA